jgi:hypothetical protein
LPAHHASGTCGRGETGNHIYALFAAYTDSICTKKLECKCLQSIANEYCRCFVKRLMDRWFASTEVIVVHCGQVVVHQRVTVNKLYGSRGGVSLFD